MQDIWRQGDVVVMKVDRIPKTAKQIEHDGVLALGETTGHKHQVVGNRVRYFMDNEKPDVLYFNVPRFATLNHGTGAGKANVPTEKREDDPKSNEEGHYTQDLPAGDYVRLPQKEYDWMSESLRSVED